jgi:hypothetical protein
MRGMLLIGALQFGITYVCLYLSFRVLTVPEVLLFTILTPLHVTLIEDALNRRFNPWALVAALVAVAGAAVIRFDGSARISSWVSCCCNWPTSPTPPARCCTSIWWRATQRPAALPAFRLLLPRRTGGGVAGLPAVRQSQLPARSTAAMGRAAVPRPGLDRAGLYWWNKGACLVNGGTLAVMNNLHVPVGLLLNLLIWNQHERWGGFCSAGASFWRRCGSAGWVSAAPHNCAGAAAGCDL